MRQRGFTLVELTVAMALISVVIVVMTLFYVNRLADANRTYTTTLLQNNTKRAVENVERNVKSAVFVEASNKLADIHSPCSVASPNCWMSNGTSLVVATPSLDTNGNVIYSNLLHTAVYTDDIIFFVDSNKILYERILANPLAPGNGAQSTCRAQDVPSLCSYKDIQVVENVATLSLRYFDTNNTVLASGQEATAGAVEITLSQTLPASNSARTYTSSFTGQASLRNK